MIYGKDDSSHHDISRPPATLVRQIPAVPGVFWQALLGLGLFGLVTLAERLLIPWHISQRRAACPSGDAAGNADYPVIDFLASYYPSFRNPLYSNQAH